MREEIALTLISIILIPLFLTTKLYSLENETAVEKATLQLKAGRLLEFKDYTIFIDNIEGNKLIGVRIFNNKEPDECIIEAERGEYLPVPEKNEIKLMLIEGTSLQEDSENPGTFFKLKFKKYYMKLKLLTDENKCSPKVKKQFK